jgi:alpha-galactosidase
MGTPIRLTVIGAGSATFSMGLVRDICLTPNLAGSLICFMDIDEERLAMIQRMAERYVQELGGKLTFAKTTDRQRALRDADFVINTAGTEYVHYAENRELAKRHGYYSGVPFSVNYDNLTIMMGVARDMERICPNAWLIQSGNPVYEGTTLMSRQTGVQVIGLCHGHYGYRNVSQVLGLDPSKVRWVAPGLNHNIWLQEFRYEGRDAYPILDAWIENGAEAYWQDRVDHPAKYGVEDQMCRAVVEHYHRFGLLPIGDTARGGGWWYKADLPTRLHWYGPTGGYNSDVHFPPYYKRHNDRVAEIARVASDPTRSVLEAFPPEKTREQQIPIIDALTNDVRGEFQINIPNRGTVPGIPDDVVAEMPAIIDMGGIHPIQCKPLPKKLMLEVIQPSVLSMEWNLETYLSADVGMLLDGLLMVNTYHGGSTTSSYKQALEYLDDMFAQPWNRRMAEHFRWPETRPA